MSRRSRWKRLLRLTESDAHIEAQVDDELRHHIEELFERYRAQGMTDEEARAEITRRFPDLETTRSALVVRTGRTVHNRRRRLYLDGLRSDFRVSLRQFRRRPGFSSLAIMTLGLGIGASTTLFSVVNGVLLRPLPYKDPSRLVFIGTVFNVRQPDGYSADAFHASHQSPRTVESYGFTAPEFLALQSSTTTLEGCAAFQNFSSFVLLGDQPELIPACGVTGDFFDLFRVSPLMGRSLAESDYQPDAPPVALLSHRAWQHYCGGDPDLVGTTMTIRREDANEILTPTIIGIIPPSFEFGSVELWVPLHLIPDPWQYRNWTISAIGRLKPDVELLEARSEIAALAASLAGEFPQHYSGRYVEGRGIGAVPLQEWFVAGHRRDLVLLFGATIVVLMIATGNIIGLFLARVLGRNQEITIRSILGAGRGRIARQLVAEMSVFALSGGLVGIAVAGAGIRVIPLLAPADIPRLADLSLDPRVVLFALIIALGCSILCGITPAFVSARRAVGWLVRSGMGIGERWTTSRLRGLLLIAEVALTTTLLIGAGLLINSYSRLHEVDLGFDTEGLIIIPIQLPGTYETAEEYTDFYSRTVRAIGTIPGITSASWNPNPPLYGRMWGPEVVFEGMDDNADIPNISAHQVGPDYFETVGIPVLSGRGITWADDANALPVVVVDELTAEGFWPGENPLGKRLRRTGQAEGPWYTVVGVAGRIRQTTLAREAVPEIYIPAAQLAWTYPINRVVVRSHLPLQALLPRLRSTIREVDPVVPVPTVLSMQDLIDRDLHHPRFQSLLMGSFALSALVLSLAGIYALMLYLITGRIREIGIRMALGANTKRVLWTVSRQCLLLIGIGIVTGLVVAIVTSRLLAGLLFGITPLDLPTYGIVTAVLGGTAVLACLVPAMRATRIDPMITLRWE